MTSLEQTSYEPYKRYLLEIAYDGGNYSGWQIQPHCLAVQEVLQGILSKMYAGHPIHLIGSSRTDAGVHAQRFAAGYLTPKRPDIPPDKIRARSTASFRPTSSSAPCAKCRLNSTRATTRSARRTPTS